MTTHITAVSSASVTFNPVTRASTTPQKDDSKARATAAPSTNVTLSNAAKAAAAEAIETPAQTAREAQGNDREAQRLLAKHALAHR